MDGDCGSIQVNQWPGDADFTRVRSLAQQEKIFFELKSNNHSFSIGQNEDFYFSPTQGDFVASSSSPPTGASV
ncbi:hypothetical protein L249_8328, partial [Ophiocordyceps polyrhachis-furcata BCC 54312]